MQKWVSKRYHEVPTWDAKAVSPPGEKEIIQNFQNRYALLIFQTLEAKVFFASNHPISLT